jgi:transketolase
MAKRSMRHEFAGRLVELARTDPRIVALEGDLKESTQSIQFEQAFPERYIDCGIAEQNMVGIAAGLALAGKIPMVHSFACFISMRTCEQVRTSVAYPRLNVKFVVSHGGISPGTAGTTHHSIEDIAIMRAIPNMTVFVPGDAEEAKQALHAALSYDGPVYIRLSASDTEDVYRGEDAFAMGKGTLLREGKDACIITTGTLMAAGLGAADQLRQKGIGARVLQMASVKPLDEKMIRLAAEETRAIITVEEHTILGGLGGAGCEIVAEIGGARVKRLGIKDRFCGVGTAAFLMGQEEITVQAIVDSVLGIVK